ncbi:hypothetical protein ACQUEE_15135 [Enterococcus casseliflavus]|uniref:hypothetical protein n=1 Tax=Enterococcus casseliflavus TaxID=37734 RepID=UPI003D1516BD
MLFLIQHKAYPFKKFSVVEKTALLALGEWVFCGKKDVSKIELLAPIGKPVLFVLQEKIYLNL